MSSYELFLTTPLELPETRVDFVYVDSVLFPQDFSMELKLQLLNK